MLSCLDKGLDVFGDSTKRVVNWNFEQQSQLKKEEIPEHMVEFSKTLKKMFGIGSDSVEKRIRAEITSFSKVKLEENDDLVAITTKVKREFLKRQD